MNEPSGPPSRERLGADIGEPLRVLRGRGIKRALDDFGTGYASLNYLRKYPPSRIKIDQTFVRTMTENAEDASIVRATITMAHSLGLEVTAEGSSGNGGTGSLLRLYSNQFFLQILGKPGTRKSAF